MENDFIKLKEEAEKMLAELDITYTLNITDNGYYFLFFFCEAPIYKLTFRRKEFNEEAYLHLHRLAKEFSYEVAIGSYRTKKTLLEYCIDNPIGVNSDYYNYSLIIK